MSPYAAAVFVRRCEVVGADGDEPGVGDLHLAMELNEPFGLPAILGTIAAAAEHEDHRIGSLQLGKVAMFSRVVVELVVRKHRPWNNVGPHETPSALDERRDAYVATLGCRRVMKP